jgi:DNA gyrase subunit B
MAKKTSKTVDKLRADVQALSEAVWALKEHVRVERAAESAANGSRKQKSPRLERLERSSEDGSSLGAVSTFGVFRLHNHQDTERRVRWQMDNAAIETLIPDDIDIAAQRLGAIGHRQRLAILVALLQQPSTVNDLVANLDLGTSGAAYHHLNVLQSAGIVLPQERGVFAVAPEQVGFLAGILAALTIEPTVEEPEAASPSPDGETPSDGASEST